MDDLGNRIIQMHLSLAPADKMINHRDPIYRGFFDPLSKVRLNHITWDFKRKMAAASKDFQRAVDVQLGPDSTYKIKIAGAVAMMSGILTKTFNDKIAYDVETNVDPYGIPEWRKHLNVDRGFLDLIPGGHSRSFVDHVSMVNMAGGLKIPKEKPFAEGLIPRLLPEKAASLIGKIVLTPHQTEDIAPYFLGIDLANGPSLSRVIKYQNGVYTDLGSIEAMEKRHKHLDEAIIDILLNGKK